MLRLMPLALALLAGLPDSLHAQSLELTRRGTYASNLVAGSEIVAHDPVTQRIFVTNGATNRVDVIDIANIDTPVLLQSIDIAPFGGAVNSVAVANGLVAVAIANASPTTPGVVAVFTSGGTLRRIFTAGVLPDPVSFSPNGNFLLAANEGEPVGTFGQPSFVDPRGSVSYDPVAGISLELVTLT